MRNVVACVLGGGRGTRLFPLTQMRAKPAVPLAGKYRLIDIPLSNCINSEINRIYLLTQFMSVSLHRHIRQTYMFDRFNDGFVEILAAQQTEDQARNWYEGTADAVRKNLRYLDQPGADLVLILSGDQLYRMDYREMVATHLRHGADATIAVLPVTRDDARQFGVMRLAESGEVVDFVEKPQTAEAIRDVALSPQEVASYGITGDRDCLASMGIYLFQLDVLKELLNSNKFEDFGREVFPHAIRTKKVVAHYFDDYWRDIGTIRSFFDANLAMTHVEPPFNLYTGHGPIYSRARFLPPSRIGDSRIAGSMIADGCRIGNDCTIQDSVIGLRCVIQDNVTIRNSILMGSDFYESDEDRARNRARCRPDVGIGAGTVIEGSIVDKNCRIGERVVIRNADGVEEKDCENLCYIRDGIAVLAKDATIPNGWRT